VKDKLEQYAVTQHTAAVSSNSPQKELDSSPPNSGLFFSPAFSRRSNGGVPMAHLSARKSRPAAPAHTGRWQSCIVNGIHIQPGAGT
jgi:hypothetical protein